MPHLRLLLIVVLVVLLPAAAPAFQPPGLSADAATYRAAVLQKRPPQPAPEAAAAAASAARRAHEAGRFDEALRRFEEALAQGDEAEAAPLWLRLSELWTKVAPANPQRALQAAWLAYSSSAAPDQRQAALVRMADIFERILAQPKLALKALSAAAAERPADDGLRARIAALRLAVGLDLRSIRVDTESDQPRVCFTFASPLAQSPAIHFEDYVRVVPELAVTAEAADDTLCLTGISHGSSAQVTLREGLPGQDGLILRQTETHKLTVGDRKPSAAFRGNAFVLPRFGPRGVPLTTVNLDAVDLELHWINDRNLAPQLAQGALMAALSRYDAGEIADTAGERVWQGRMAVGNERNKSVVTAIPVKDLLPSPKPGLYVVTARPADIPEADVPYTAATRWLMISDLGLTAMQGADGLSVFVRSLSTAKPLPGVTVALVARNNAELARLTSDAGGRVRFPAIAAGLRGGSQPTLVMAYGADADFAALNLTEPAFDLSDRGVGGRVPPGPVDAYLFSERGVYRPAEVVHITALMRDNASDAIEGVPLTLKVLRPNGTTFHAGVVPAAAPGAHVLSLQLTASAPLGTWSVQAFTDPQAQPVGRLEFQVEEFVPERLAVEVSGSAPVVTPGTPFELTVRSRFLYGAPASGLEGSADVVIDADPAPYPQHKGFRFGLAQESVTARTETMALAATDASGTVKASLKLPPVPDTTRPLKADVRVAIFEPGGRPSRQVLTLPLRTQAFALGLRPRFADDRLPEGAEAGFELIAVDADGKPIDKQGLSFELFAEEINYQWYMQEGAYKYRTSVRSRSIRKGAIAVAALKPTPVAVGPLTFGRYRLEVSAPGSLIASSVRFTVGWQSAAAADDTPDKLDVTTDKATYRPGETARVRIATPFAGEALVTVATDHILDSRTVSVPTEGVTVDLPVTAAWGTGAYVIASVYRPPLADRDHLPVRAIGLAWLATDPAPRSLTVALSAPDKVRPRQTIEVPLKLTDADGKPVQDAFVMLAAVDEGILQLTGYRSPDPVQHFLGKRRLGLDMRDDYQRLIDAVSGPMGALRQGGDAGGLGVSLPDVPLTIVSLFQGPVQTNTEGTARIALTLPDFNGSLRLMAVAFDRSRVGSASAPLVVRDPLVAEMALPRFLAPGDESQVSLSLHAVEAPAGTYRVVLQGLGAVTTPDDIRTLSLTPGQRISLQSTLKGSEAGRGLVKLAVTGPADTALTRELALTVRPAQAPMTTFATKRLEPGAEVVATAQMTAGYVPGTASVRLGFSTRPPFDVAGLLAALQRYPHGCLEQIVSRALPLLVVDDVDLALGRERTAAATLAARIDAAIAEVLDKQRYDGAFGLWSGRGPEEPWLTAYALDFLARARGKGHAVPAVPFEAGLRWLHRHAVDGGSEPQDLASRAYALHVLAQAGVATPGSIRYFNDTFRDRLPTPLARGQMAAALVRLGDGPRAETAVERALGNPARDFWQSDYGSTVRDAAALITLLSEVERLGDGSAALIDRLPADALSVRATNTQEQAWLVLAARTLMAGPAPLKLAIAGTPARSGDPVFLSPTARELADGVKITNAGPEPIWHTTALAGVAREPQPAAREGFKIKRLFFRRNGEPANLDAVRQNDVLVIVLEGEAATKLAHQALLTHPLPAGWEIENPRLGAETAEALPWLGELSEPTAYEARDDRYVAAVDLTPETPAFRLAYLVRAVTPGSYDLPGAVLEDMYRPRYFARQAGGRITVQPAP
jgi:hypothetical protein